MTKVTWTALVVGLPMLVFVVLGFFTSRDLSAVEVVVTLVVWAVGLLWIWRPRRITG